MNAPHKTVAISARTLAAVLVIGLIPAACGTGERPGLAGVAEEVVVAGVTDPTVPIPEELAVTDTAPATPPSQPADSPDQPGPETQPVEDQPQAEPPAPDPHAAPSGRTFPAAPTRPKALAAGVIEVERALRDPSTPASELPDLGHRQQIMYAKLAGTEEWDAVVFAALPEDLKADVTTHLDARRALIGLHGGYSLAEFVPAWEVIEPAPAADLLAYYREAEAATGIEWEYLAAINVIESASGRIRGLSSAGARGPMQFIKTTWDESGIGEGDIDDPRDAIAAAARYLVRRGGPANMEQALFGYNNDERYVEAVSDYAELLRRDEANFIGMYNWEVHISGKTGDLWFPVGYRRDEPQRIEKYEAQAPWSIAPNRR